MSLPHEEVSILLVEDDDVDAKSVLRGLSKLKLINPVVRVKNGLEALTILRGAENEEVRTLQKPYIVLLDLNMPVMGGLDFLKEVRSDELLRGTVIFVLTTSDADEDRVAAYRENVAGYIVKSDVQNGFNEVIAMLDCYWRIVLLPS